MCYGMWQEQGHLESSLGPRYQLSLSFKRLIRSARFFSTVSLFRSFLGIWASKKTSSSTPLGFFGDLNYVAQSSSCHSPGKYGLHEQQSAEKSPSQCSQHAPGPGGRSTAGLVLQVLAAILHPVTLGGTEGDICEEGVRAREVGGEASTEGRTEEAGLGPVNPTEASIKLYNTT